MEQLTLNPIKSVHGEINLPGSKSVSNRALLLAALANGTSTLTNLLDSDDIRHMLNALSALNVQYSLSNDRTECTIKGINGTFESSQLLELFLGNAGTAMRPLAAALSISKGEFILTGEPRMKERPIAHLVDAMRALNADITYLENDGFPPLKIKGTNIEGGVVNIDGSISSQFLTALLMVAPLFCKDTQINIIGELVSKPYIDITLHIMRQFGVIVEHKNYQEFFVKGKQTYQAVKNFLVEGDASSASYFLAAAAINGEVKVTGIGRNSIQGDIKFADALEKMGAQIEWGEDYILARKGTLTGVDLDCNAIPDAAMTIATTALFAKGETLIRNVYNWRVKETDRLFAVATELRKLGAIVEEGKDYLKITPPEKLISANIDTYDDHRMAMCFSLAAFGNVAITINDPGCTMKTFPDYFEKLHTLICYK